MPSGRYCQAMDAKMPPENIRLNKALWGAEWELSHRLRASQPRIDRVAAMSVEGMSRAAIARVEHIDPHTVDRWLGRASTAAERFNDTMIQNVLVHELQADELQTVASQHGQPTWVFTAIERLNLTVRHCCAYLGRRRLSHARGDEHLTAHLELVRCFYNFIRFRNIFRTNTTRMMYAVNNI
jgi:hypothetical protein